MKLFCSLAGRKARIKMQPPLTPMIDVTFQLLLFFLTATTWRLAEGQLPGSLPDPDRHLSAAAMEQLIKPVAIHLRYQAGGAVAYDVQGATFSQPGPLAEHLAALRRALGSDEVPVVIQPDPDVPWEYVVEAYNQVLRSHFKTLSLGQVSG